MEIKEVFEPVLNFIKSLQKKDKEPASKQAAKDRLKLVLMQDRASVSPDFFEMMKKEIIDVIKKYIEIDEESLEVELTRGLEAGLEGPALYANIPIKNVKPIAPKGEDTNDSDDVELEMVEEVIEPQALLTEAEAEKMAESILENLEKTAKVDAGADSEEIEEENVISDEPDGEDFKIVAADVSKELIKAEKLLAPKKEVKKKTSTVTTTKKTTTKKPAAKKVATTKKATTTKSASAKKTATTKKKKE